MGQRPLIPFLFAFIGGIIAGRFLLIHGLQPTFFVFALLCAGLLLTLFLPSSKRFPCFLALFFLFGLLSSSSRKQDSDLLSPAERRETVTLEGTVLEPVRVFRGTARLVVRAERLLLADRARVVNGRLRVTVYNEIQRFLPGDRILFRARLRPFKNFSNPGGYDYESSMRLKGFCCGASVSDGRSIVPLGPGDLGFPMNLVERMRRPVRELFQDRLSFENQALYRALILGERQDINPKLRESFIISGLGHVLAVSGLHIGLIAWLVFSLLKRLFSLSYPLTLKIDIRKLAAFLTCIPVVAYTCLAGCQISSQRAMIMVLAFLFSIAIGREKETWSTLALAAFLILTLNPYALFGISFQLSFSAVIGILWLTPPLYRKIPMKPLTERSRSTVIRWILTYFTGLIVVTVSATVFLLPITAFYFHRLSLAGLPANLTVIPILGLWVIPMGLLSAFCAPFLQSLAEVFLLVGGWGLEWMRTVVDFWAHFRWAEFWVVTPNIFEIGLFYGFLSLLFLSKGRKWARIGLVILSLVLMGDIAYWVHRTRFNRDLKITCLDVGQGSSAFIQFPGGKRMILDGGGFARDTFDVGQMVVAPFLLQSKIRRIDYIVLSHPESDHMNGLRFIASRFSPKEFWHNGDTVKTRSFLQLMRILDDEGIEKLLPENLAPGRNIAGVQVELLHPLSGGSGAAVQHLSGLNDRSLVLKLTYSGKSVLFTGDIEGAAEKVLVSRTSSRLKADILIVPHHGSKSSSTASFLKMVAPSIAVISCGSGTYQKFPHDEALKRLRATGSRIIRTDEAGAVSISIGEKGIAIETAL